MAGVHNHLIELLPRAGRRTLLALCEPVDLVLSERLCAAGEPTRYAYFPVNAMISLVTAIDGKPVLEVGMVGREGMVGAELVLGVLTTPWHAVVQGPGAAWRIPSRTFRRELKASPALRLCLDRYLFVLMAQLGAAAACLRFHLIGPRLARWLLMMQDRAHSDHFHVTHEFMAYMLGVRRVGITAAAGTLQRSGLIEYRRGELIVLSRSGLEDAACGCYAADRRSYAALLS
jgi:CRP-like cAMP-binding protein